MSIRFEDVSFSFLDKPILNHFSFVFEDGVKYAIMAPSGSGKTTLLNLILGFETPSQGQIFCDTAPSVLFQQDRLFSWYDVEKNLQLTTGATQKQIIDHLEQLGLQDELHAMPKTLSGGMRRRIALCRAVLYSVAANRPLLLDEPLKGLDETLKQKAICYLSQYTKHALCIVITHDPNEASEIADVILKAQSAPLVFEVESCKKDTP